MRAIFVSPHLDDVALSCGGLVAKCARRGDSPHVVSVFTGGPDPSDPLSELAHALHASWGNEPDRAWSARREEDARAMDVLGAAHTWLGLRDGLYRGYDSREAILGPVRDDESALAADVRATLLRMWRETKGATVFLPLALGGHVDHRLCASLAAGLRAEGVHVAHYEDFPYVVRFPEAIDERTRETGAAESWTEDVTAELDTRLDAMACYTSQIEMLSRSGGPLPARVRAYASGLAGDPTRHAERFWRLPSPKNA